MKIFTAPLTAALLMFSAVASQAIPIGLSSDKYVGSIVDGAPANPASEVQYINLLIDMTINTVLGPGVLPNTTGETLTRSGNFGFPPDAILTGATKDETPTAGESYSLTGFSYLLVKTGGASYVFYVASLSGNYELDNSFPSGISHVARYNSSGSVTPFGNVPDGGTTLVSLGVALLGLGFTRRLIGSKAKA